jgi:hypothetical protein
MRHARVLSVWKKRYDSAGYDRENQNYDLAPIELFPPVDIPIEKVYVSTLPRSAATADCLVGEKNIETTPLLDEVPIRSFMDSRRMLPTWLWNAMATIQWLAGSKRQFETKALTDRKIDAFLDMVEAAGEDCIVVGHGIHFYEMMKRMKRRGYRGRVTRYMRNGETRTFEFAARARSPAAGGKNRKDGKDDYGRALSSAAAD